jgi:AcrR family transcriptional regulator
MTGVGDPRRPRRVPKLARRRVAPVESPVIVRLPTPSSGSKPPAAPRTSLREQQKQFTRQRLIDGALQMFQEAGYAATTVDDIAAAAGASRATFYLHFASKLELVRDLAEGLKPEIGAYYDSLDQILVEDDSYEALREWMVGAVGWFDAHRTFVTISEEVGIVERFEGGAPLVAATYVVDRMPKFLARQPRRQRERFRLRISLLVAELSGACRMWFSGDFDVTFDDLVDELTELWHTRLELGA